MTQVILGSSNSIPENSTNTFLFSFVFFLISRSECVEF